MQKHCNNNTDLLNEKSSGALSYNISTNVPVGVYLYVRSLLKRRASLAHAAIFDIFTFFGPYYVYFDKFVPFWDQTNTSIDHI